MQIRQTRNELISHPLTVVLLLALVGIAGYGNAVHAPFFYDDLPNIIKNPNITITELSFDSLTGAAKSALRNRPLAYISFAFNYFLHGFNTTGYHFFNILIHLITGFCVFVLTRQTMVLCRIKNPATPLLTAIFWTSMPLHTQSVTYIVQRMNTMATMFYMLALISYIHARQIQTADHIKNNWRITLFFSGCLVSGLLGLMTKEIVATLPFFILFYEWYFFQGLSISWLKKNLKWIVGVFLISGSVSLIYLDYAPLKQILAEYDYYEFTLAERLLTQSMVIVYFLSLIAFPHPARLNLIYDFPLSQGITNPPITILCLLTIAAGVTAAIYMAKRNRLFSFAILWFMGNLFIESSFIGLHLIFEHRTYLPSILPIMTTVIFFLQLSDSRKTVVIILCAAIAVNLMWTRQRNNIWQNRITFWQDQAVKTPLIGLPFNRLALAYARDKQGYQQALETLNRALKINQRRYGNNNLKTVNCYYDLGEIHRIHGNFDQALMAYNSALRIIGRDIGIGQDKIASIYNNMGMIHKDLKNFDQAIDYYRQAIKLLQLGDLSVSPVYLAGTWNNLGLAFADAGRHQQAIDCLEKALNIINSNLGQTHPLAKNIEKKIYIIKKNSRI